MNKIFQLLFIIIFFSGCSFNKNSKFWTSETIKKIEEQINLFNKKIITKVALGNIESARDYIHIDNLIQKN